MYSKQVAQNTIIREIYKAKVWFKFEFNAKQQAKRLKVLRNAFIFY